VYCIKFYTLVTRSLSRESAKFYNALFTEMRIALSRGSLVVLTSSKFFLTDNIQFKTLQTPLSVNSILSYSK